MGRAEPHQARRPAWMPEAGSSSLPDNSLSSVVSDVELRRFRRWSVALQTIITFNELAYACAIQDLSPAGARIQLIDPANFAVSTQAILDLTPFGSIPSEIRHDQEEYLGLMFLHGESGEISLARHLISLRPQRRPSRVQVNLEATLSARGIDQHAVITNFSPRGANLLINDARHLSEGDMVSLGIPGRPPISATIRRNADGAVGLMFLQAQSLDPTSSTI